MIIKKIIVKIVGIKYKLESVKKYQLKTCLLLKLSASHRLNIIKLLNYAKITVTNLGSYIKHPFLQKLSAMFKTLQSELSAHFLKEEKIIFPHIKNLVNAKKTNTAPVMDGIDNIQTPLQVMEADHEAAGGLLAEMRALTNGYTLPADACNSFALLYHKMKALEEDLHQHIHLENNILFAKAAKLEKELLAKY